MLNAFAYVSEYDAGCEYASANMLVHVCMNERDTKGVCTLLSFNLSILIIDNKSTSIVRLLFNLLTVNILALKEIYK